MKGLFVVNKYYKDDGMEYVYSSLSKAFCLKGASIIKASPHIVYGGGQESAQINKKIFEGIDFVLFWDKDLTLAAQIERCGIRVFNNAKALMICDDKQKTYSEIPCDIPIPKTITAPVMYDINDTVDYDFLDMVASELSFPLIIKQNTGSQGRQVFKADNFEQLICLYDSLKRLPHHYQQMVGEYGKDIRIYTVGHKAVAACIRQGTDYKSNLFAGGKMKPYDLTKEYKDMAERISESLALDYGAVDFLIADTPIFLEVNSNAYLKGIESLGINISDKIAEYVLSVIKKQ